MLTQAHLKSVLRYVKTTGTFYWLVNRGKARVGQIAGTLTPEGYLRIKIGGVSYAAHRLAWFYVFGEWPRSLDHKDTKRANNAWRNLRLCTKVTNARNSKGHADSVSGLKGVDWHSQHNKWRARIKVDCKQLHLGLFATSRAAHDAYTAAAQEHFGPFARPA